MSNFIEDFFTFLTTAGTPAANRFYPYQLPQDVVLPAVRYFRVSNPKDHTHSGPSALHYPRLQLDCYGVDHPGAVSLAISLETLLDGYKGPMAATTVQASFMEEAGRDNYDPETDRHWVSLEVVIWHNE